MIAARDFLGRWSAARRIDDRLTGTQGRFEGEAEVTGEAEMTGGADVWRYRERGTLRLGAGQAFQAERVYLWTPRRDDQSGAPGIDVSFEDGRFFHHMTLGRAGQAAHWCDPDQYDVRYDFSGWPVWRAVWTVKGPRKDYSMHTVYAPLAQV